MNETSFATDVKTVQKCWGRKDGNEIQKYTKCTFEKKKSSVLFNYCTETIYIQEDIHNLY